MHDGSRILLRKFAQDYDPTDRIAASAYIQARLQQGEFLTGLLYIDETQKEFHELNGTPDAPLNSLSLPTLSPGAQGLQRILARYR